MIRSNLGLANLGLASLASALALASSGVAVAQTAPPGGSQPGGMRMMEMRRPDPEARAQKLRDVLQLTPAQDPALKAFLEAQKPTRPPAPPEAGAKALTAPERLNRQRARLVERLAEFDRRAAAARTFYAQLTPTQKKAFDALPAAGRDRLKARMHRRMMEPGDGPGGPRARDKRPE